MRLSHSQLAKIIQTTTAVAGPFARVSIYGSRLDERAAFQAAGVS
jgi:hypothetical protein